MALNSQSIDVKTGNATQTRQIFTFFIQDMMFGIDVSNVLMLGQEVNQIQRLPVEERGLCGVVKFQGVLVPVLDYAHRIGVDSGMDSKQALIEQLNQREQDHIEWLNELELCIKSDKVFNKELDPEQCAFGHWYKMFDSRDQTLTELMQQFEQPHHQLHSYAEQLIQLSNQGNVEQAVELLEQARNTALKRLQALFVRARDQIQSGMRPVLLYVTEDGKTPRYALLIDEINDVINYSQQDFQASQSGALGSISKIEQVLEGIFTKQGQPDCLYFDIKKLTDIDALMAKAG